MKQFYEKIQDMNVKKEFIIDRILPTSKALINRSRPPSFKNTLQVAGDSSENEETKTQDMKECKEIKTLYQNML